MPTDYKSERGIGRTTNMLKLAAEAAATSPLVIVVVHEHSFIGYAMGCLSKVASLNGVRNNEAVIGNSRIRFLVEGENLVRELSGLNRNTPLFYDHAVRAFTRYALSADRLAY